MGHFRLYTSNRVETLAKALITTLRTPLTSPFEKETIIVQSRGMQRWLTMQIASSLGIASHLDFPFPVSFFYNLFLDNLSETHSLTEDNPYDQEVLTWSIIELLEKLLLHPEFTPVREYL